MVICPFDAIVAETAVACSRWSVGVARFAPCQVVPVNGDVAPRSRAKSIS